MASPIKMCGQKPALLMIAYTRSLQYWAEKQSPPRSWNLHPLAGSVVELREVVKEYITFNHWDVIRGLRTEKEPQATIFSQILSSPSEDQEAGRATTHATGTAAKKRYGQTCHLTGQNQNGEPLSIICHGLCGTTELRTRCRYCWEIHCCWKCIPKPMDGCHLLNTFQSNLL